MKKSEDELGKLADKVDKDRSRSSRKKPKARPYRPPREPKLADKSIDKEDYGKTMKLKAQGLEGIREFLLHHGMEGIRWNTGKDGIEIKFSKPRKRWGVKLVDEYTLIEKKALQAMHQEIKTYSVVGKKSAGFGMGWDTFFTIVCMEARGLDMHNDWEEFWKGVKSSQEVKDAKDDSFMFKAFLKCFDLPEGKNGKKRKDLTKFEKDAIRMAFSTMVRRQKAAMKGDEAGVHARVSLCLRGPKKCGKSSFFGQVFPDSMRSRLYNGNLRLNVPWEKNYRNTSGRGICHVADVHRYKASTIEDWYSDADLEVDSVLFLYEQGGRTIPRCWALVYSANRDAKLANFDQFFDRLGIVDVEAKTDKKGNRVPRAAYEFFRKKGNREKFLAAVYICAKKFNPSEDWKDEYEAEQIKRGKATVACPNDAICEKLFNELDRKQHYQAGAVQDFIERNFDKIDWARHRWLIGDCMKYCGWQRPGKPMYYKGLDGNKVQRVWVSDDWDGKSKPPKPVMEL